MPKTIDDAALVLLSGGDLDTAADKFHVWDDSAGQDKHMTLDAIAAAKKFFDRAPDYDSGEQTVSADTVLPLAHGLGAIPRDVVVRLRCKTGDANYSSGEEIPVPTGVSNGGVDRGVTISMDATNIYIVQPLGIQVIDKSTFNSASITVGNWKWVARAWK